MAIKTIQYLKEIAAKVRDACEESENTAVRIGCEFLDIIDTFDNIINAGGGGGIEEAPVDGKIYGRRNGAWIEIGTEAPTTDIEFEITLPQAATEIPDLIRMSSPSGHGQAIIDWGDGSTETVTVPEGELQEATMTDGSVYAWVEGAPFGHTYASAGTYTVKITSYASVDAIYFSTRQEPSNGDWAALPVTKPLITKMNKFRSNSLQSLYYTFAGLVNMQMDEDFVLETPKVNNISFMMWGCGNNLADFNLPAGLLSQITLPAVCYRTFYDSGVRFIPEGFLNSLTGLTSAFEMFRACGKLGYDWYNNPLSDNGANDFIPVSLFHKCTKLQNITGIFNWIGQGWFGSYATGHSYKAPVRRDLFKNTKIVMADFAFYKWNRINIEPDVFGHIKDTLQSAEGIFNECNECAPTTGYGTVRAGFTNDLGAIFPEDSYPLITNLIVAFAPSNPDNGAILSFSGGWTSGTHSQVKLDLAAFIAKFPNCKAGSAHGGGDGRTGAFKNLENNCDNWDTVAAIDDGIWVNV